MRVDLVGGERAVEAAQQPALVVVGDQRRRLLVVDLEASADRLGAVVVALHELGAVGVGALLRRGVEIEVVDATALGVDAPPGEALDDDLVGRIQNELKII